MSEILFLAHRMPFPPDRGDKIRSHHLLRALAKLAPVHVATFAETDGDREHEGELAAIAASHCLVQRSTNLALQGVEALISGDPVSLTAFSSRTISRYVDSILSERPISTIYVFSGQMGQYVPASYPGRLVMDLVDVDSAKFEAYAQDRRGPRAWIDAREGRLLRAEEQRLAARAHATLLVSEAEAELFRSRVPADIARRIQSLGNGIDTAYFDPKAVSPDPALLQSEGPHLVFTGQMDYAPNVAAALRAIEGILPAIRTQKPQAELHIVGRAPTRELLAHDGRDGVRVWGEVPDIRPFLAGAQVVLVPLSIARGIQNKVLEAMAMARPVVLTPGAATGIGAIDGKHLAVEETDRGIAARCLEMIAHKGAAQTMGRAARKYVEQTRGWDSVLAPLGEIIGLSAKGEVARDAA